MIFGQSKLEMKVGIFVFIGLAILTTFILSMKDFKSMTVGYELNFIFNFANGVKIGAPVRFAGVDVGEIKEIDFVSMSDDPMGNAASDYAMSDEPIGSSDDDDEPVGKIQNLDPDSMDYDIFSGDMMAS